MHAFIRYMKRHGLTQTQFAERMGLSQGTVSLAISGRKPLGHKAAIRIAKKTKGEIPLEEIRPDIWGRMAVAISPP